MSKRKREREAAELRAMIGPELAAAVEEEHRQRPLWERASLRADRWRSRWIGEGARLRILGWLWRFRWNWNAMLGYFEDEGIPAGAWMNRPGQSASRGRLWLQVLAGRLFGREH
jgi:hypothetical protein